MSTHGTLIGALEDANTHQQATGHESRIILSVRIENRSESTKFLTHGGRGLVQAECRVCR